MNCTPTQRFLYDSVSTSLVGDYKFETDPEWCVTFCRWGVTGKEIEKHPSSAVFLKVGYRYHRLQVGSATIFGWGGRGKGN